MRLVDIEELKGCAIIRPTTHEEMSHVLACKDLVKHDDIPTAEAIPERKLQEVIDRINEELDYSTLYHNKSEIMYRKGIRYVKRMLNELV